MDLPSFFVVTYTRMLTQICTTTSQRLVNMDPNKLKINTARYQIIKMNKWNADD